MFSQIKLLILVNILFTQLVYGFSINFNIGNDAISSSGAIAYLSPVPNSNYNSVRSTIIIKLIDKYIKRNLTEIEIVLFGTISGKVTGRKIFSDDKSTIIFKPDAPFAFGEKVEVKILDVSKVNYENRFQTFSYTFIVENEGERQNTSISNFEGNINSNLKEQNSLLKTPKLITKIYNSSAIDKGKLFLSSYGVINQTFQSSAAINSSILIAENDGTLIYSKDIGSNKGAGLTDFKMHPNGLMSYPKVLKNYQWTGGAEVIHMVMDKSYAVVDSFQMGNGYTAETHDFQILPNGHALLMAYYLTPIDLSGIVPNSHPNAFIDGAVIQELDSEKNVVFQWRTWDYLSPSNIPWNLVRGATQQFINVFHLNSIRMDNDNNLLLGTSSNGIKINRQTGKVMWIIGGFNNQFTFTNVALSEAIGDFGGHTFHRLPNGNILVLDNSPFPWQQGYGQISSEVVEYKIDEEKRTAELVWKYKPEKIISGWHAGSVQRLPNGNTLICWGGPPIENGVSIPIATEVTQGGEKVFELFFEGSELESYRAFRFDIDLNKPAVEVFKEIVFALNTYDFKKNENNDTGISIKINSMESIGYNMLTVKRMLSSPSAPKFNSKTPVLLPGSCIISSFGIAKITASLRFDVKVWGIPDPANTIIYYRPNAGEGIFVPLETTYNFVTGKITAEIKELGEFVLGKSDLAAIPYAPIPNSPVNNTSVNYNIPLAISWSPVGFATKYSMQIAADEAFNKILIDEKNMSQAIYKFNMPASKTKYFWRVKTINDAGESNWCTVQSFSASAPFINVKKPNGNERWHIGLDYYIYWESNIIDSVTILLLRKNEVVEKITKTNNTFYLWEININSKLSNDYQIKIVSSADTSLYDYSNSSFSIVDTVTSVMKDLNNPYNYSLLQNYPNPFNSSTTIQFNLPKEIFTSVVIYNSLGQSVAVLINEELKRGSYLFNWNAENFPSGVYYCRITSGIFSETKKLILLK